MHRSFPRNTATAEGFTWTARYNRVRDLRSLGRPMIAGIRVTRPPCPRQWYGKGSLPCQSDVKKYVAWPAI